MKEFIFTLVIIFVIFRVFKSSRTYFIVNKQNNTFNKKDDSYNTRPKGEMSIDYIPDSKQKKKKSSNGPDGEFTDYEEVK